MAQLSQLLDTPRQCPALGAEIPQAEFDLRRDIEFRSTVAAAHWDEAAKQWHVTLESGQQAASRFLFTAIGILSAYTLPAIPGRDSFKGPAYHPARWPHTPVDFTGKRLGIISTGAIAERKWLQRNHIL